MKDVNLNSGILRVKDLPQETEKIMIMYDERGWCIRCYDESGNKITTMIPDARLADGDSAATLVRRESTYEQQ